MAYIIHRFEKYHSINDIKAHIERGEDYKPRSTLSHIDPSRTHLNEFLEPSQILTDKMVKEQYRTRKNAVLAIEGLYTASPEFFKDKPKWFVTNFFQECLEFHREHYGKVFSAVVHYDETTPHMHVLSLPEKDGKLSAKSFVDGPTVCAKMQDLIAEEIGARYGLERGEKKSRRAHTTALQYHMAQTKERERKLQKIVTDTQKRLEEAESEEAENEKAWALIKHEYAKLKAEKEEVKRMSLKRAKEVIAMAREEAR